MKRYGNEMKRMLIAVIVIAAIIATGILLTTYYVTQPDDSGPVSEHTTDLPRAPLAIIVQSGIDGTRVIADLEIGFMKSEYDYLIGYRRDFLDIHNGYNRSDVIGLGYTALGIYSFAYLGDVKLFDYRENGVPEPAYEDQPSWTSNDAEGSHTGPIRKENLTELSNAGVIFEFIDFSIYFEDGSNFVCGPSRLMVGVNFTRNGSDWIIDYIFDASDNESIYFAPASVSIQLRSPVPEKAEDTEITGQSTESIEMPIILLAAPTVIALILILLIIVVTRRRI
jgi:hypothetical protein